MIISIPGHFLTFLLIGFTFSISASFTNPNEYKNLDQLVFPKYRKQFGLLQTHLYKAFHKQKLSIKPNNKFNSTSTYELGFLLGQGKIIGNDHELLQYKLAKAIKSKLQSLPYFQGLRDGLVKRYGIQKASKIMTNLDFDKGVNNKYFQFDNWLHSRFNLKSLKDKLSWK